MLIGWCTNDDSSSKRISSHNSSSSKRSTSHLSRNSNSSTINSYRSRRSSHGHHKYSKGKKERKEKERKATPPEHISVVESITNKSIHFNSTQDDGISLQQYQENLKKAQTQNTQGMAGFNAPVSPLDGNKFFPGCNNGIQGATESLPIDQELYMAGISQHMVQNQQQAPVTPMLQYPTPLKRNIGTKVQFKDKVSSKNGQVFTEEEGRTKLRSNLLKRQALPQSVKWEGTQDDNTFEDFLGLITAHVGQQAHLVYIIIPSFQSLWLKIGDVYQVLGLARRMKLHESLKYITEEQFTYDITWLYNALKQAIGNGKGLDIILRYKDSFDGIAAYHVMINRFHYGGDMQTYKANQETILTTNFTRKYPSGPLAYIDAWEKAAVRLEVVAPDENLSENAKRSKFAQ